MNELKCFRKTKMTENELSEQVLQIKVDEIRPNRAQPRAKFDQNSIIRLADSIRRYGILQPLTVRRSEPEDSCAYELIAGERRLRAARMLGYLTVPCVVKDTDDKTSAELAIIENLLREDLNMFEEAYGYKKLIENHCLTQDEVAKRMSVSQSAVANKLRLLRLGYEEQQLILEHGLTERHARALLRVDDPAERLKILEFIIENHLNVGASETYIENFLANSCGFDKKKQEIEAESSPVNKEKELHNLVSIIRKRVDTWTEFGESADINVINRSNGVEIMIKLYK